MKNFIPIILILLSYFSFSQENNQSSRHYIGINNSVDVVTYENFSGRLGLHVNYTNKRHYVPLGTSYYTIHDNKPFGNIILQYRIYPNNPQRRFETYYFFNFEYAHQQKEWHQTSIETNPVTIRKAGERSWSPSF